MAKKSKEEKKSGVNGKVVFSVALAVGSAIAAFVASKFLSKRGQLEEPVAENDKDTEVTEDNYITLDNEVAPEKAQATDEAAAAEEDEEPTAADAVEEEAEAAEEDEEDVTDDEDDDDLIKCIRD